MSISDMWSRLYTQEGQKPRDQKKITKATVMFLTAQKETQKESNSISKEDGLKKKKEQTAESA